MLVIVPWPINSYIKHFSYRPDNIPLALLPPRVVRSRGAWPCRNTATRGNTGLGNWPGCGALAPGPRSVPRLVSRTKRPRRLGIVAGGLSVPICVNPECAIGIGRPVCRPGHGVITRMLNRRALCTEGRAPRPWRLVWLIYAPKGHPSASSPACPGCAGYLDAKTAKHVHFPYRFPSIELE